MITLDALRDYENEVIEIYKQIHQNPEFGWEEYETTRLIKEKLSTWGIPYQDQLALTGVVGTLDSGRPGKTILLRADMDALPITEQSGCSYSSTVPGKMHACGHDSHVAMLLGAAKYLSEHRNDFQGIVKFVFQPAEETSDKRANELAALGLGTMGAEIMIKQGVADDVDACFAIHVDPKTPRGTAHLCWTNTMASNDMFTCKLESSGGHGAMPHLSSDIVTAMTKVVEALHSIPARQTSALDCCVVNIGAVSTPGSRWNVVPSEVVMEGTVRTYSERVRERTFDLIENRLSKIADMYNCKYALHRTKYAVATINDQSSSQFANDVCRAIMGEEHVNYADDPSMGAEDFGFFLQKKPGALIWLGAADPSDPNPYALHSPHVKFDLNAFLYGVAVHVNLVSEFK